MTEPLRLLVDAHCFDGEYQGSRTFVKELYSVLAQKPGLRLYLAAHDMALLRKEFADANVQFLRYRSRSPLVRLAYEIPHLIRRHRIDFAHFQYIAPLIKNCRQIVTIHDLLFCDYPGEFPLTYRWLRRRLFRRAAKAADLLTTVSEHSKEKIRLHFGIGSDEIHVIPNGVSKRFSAPHNKVEAIQFIEAKYGIRNFVLYVSRIEPRKNHELLLKTFLDLQLHREGYQLLFIGHESLPVFSFRKELASLPPEAHGSVLVLNKVSEEDLLQFYRAARVFVYPSKAEGFGIPPLEAAAARTPVICANTTAMRDYTFFGDHHIAPTEESLSKSLQWVLSSAQESETLQALAGEVQQRYDWQQSAEKFYQLIKAKA